MILRMMCFLWCQATHGYVGVDCCARLCCLSVLLDFCLTLRVMLIQSCELCRGRNVIVDERCWICNQPRPDLCRTPKTQPLG